MPPFQAYLIVAPRYFRRSIAQALPLRVPSLRIPRKFTFVFVIAGIASICYGADVADRIVHGQAWPRHVIDNRFDGPDGTKLADLNGDNLLDVVTGWESEGLTVAYLHPGHRFVKRSWPSVVVGSTPKAEDAVFVDLNRDGNLDVVTTCEQHVEKVFVHWSPPREKLLIPQAWRQESFAAVSGVSQWMFAEPISFEDDKIRGLALGGKNYRRDQTAELGLLLPGTDPLNAHDYLWHPLAKLSWTMSIIVADLNGDGRQDILYSDKHGPGCGVWWLENPGPKYALAKWTKHKVIAGDLDGCMLIEYADVDGDGLSDIVAPVDFPKVADQPRQRRIRLARRLDSSGTKWSIHDIDIAPNSGQPKAVTVGDVNGDGKPDLVVTSTGATEGQMGTYWLEQGADHAAANWKVHRIAGPEGIKYDLVHLLDLDGDGDLDVLTSEEKQDNRGLGVFWYENPAHTPAALVAPR
jgi:hypothetical protein